MEPVDILTYLKRMRMFQSLDDNGEDDLFRLVPYVREHVYEDGEFLYHVNHPPDSTTLILDGTVDVSSENDSGQVQSLGTRGAGEILGRTSLEIAGFEFHDAKARGEVHVLEIPFRDLVKAYQNSEALRMQMAGTLSPAPLVKTLKTIPLFETATMIPETMNFIAYSH